MTMGNKKNVPAIRFKGFAEEWNESKMGRIGIPYNGLSGKTKDDFGHGDAKFITYMNVFSNPVSNLSQTEKVEIDNKQNSVKYGDILFTVSSETPDEVGMSSVWLGNEDNIDLNSFCFGYRLIVHKDPYYMAYVLRSKSIRKLISLLAQGISRYNISKGRVMEIALPFPDNNEQKAIGNYFQNIDKLIVASQTKLDKLKNIKKACLEKMFPRNGSNTPELRFKRFANKLKYVYLKDIGSWDKGCGLSKADLNKEGLYPCIHYGELFSYSEIIKNVMSFTNKKSDKTTSNNDILFPDSDVTPVGLGRCSAIEIPNIILGGGINVLRLYKDFKAPYISLNVNNNRKQIIEKVTGTTVRHIHSKDLSDIGFFASDNLTEQQKIGDYFAELDNLIAKTEQQINKLKNIKKACLDKMFVNRKD